MLRPIYIFSLFIGILSVCNGARILGLIPTPSYSHQIIFQPIFKELARRGHEVVYFTTNPTHDKSLPTLQEGDWSGAYEIWNRNLSDMVNNWNPFFFIKSMMEVVSEFEDFELSHPLIQKILQNETEHFDLILIEQMWGVFAAFKHKFNCPLISMTSLPPPNGAHRIMGNPVHYVLYPEMFANLSEDPNFFERLGSVLISTIIDFFSYFYYGPIANEKIKKTFGEDFPNGDVILDSTDMLFINVNPVFSEVRPLVPATITIGGGIHLEKPKPLPDDIKKFLDQEKEGVIYFSLGSNVKSKDIPKETREVILNVFAKMPYKILWKFELEDLPGKPENVKLMKWVPQQDVLRHPNIKLFVTQGGLQSLEEALFSHVPMLVIPFFGDQQYNAEKVKQKGVGRVLDYKKLTSEEFEEALWDVIKNPKYKEKVVHYAKLLRDEPMNALEKAIWWIEYVIRNKGAKHLKGPGSKMPFYQYFYLDVIIFVTSFIAIILATFYYVTKICLSFIYKKCFRTKEKTQ